jgi:D-alanine-D-alanine ligase
MKILVIYGGEGLSQEFEISRNSGEQVFAELTRAGFTTDKFYLTEANLFELESSLDQYDFIWPALHGTFGEDGQIQKILENHKVRYLGSTSTSSALCFDKNACKQRLTDNQILVPKGKIVSSLAELEQIVIPAFAKPNQQGSGLGIIKINQLDKETIFKLDQALKEFGELLVEEFIEGAEISVGILDNKALPVAEIIPPNQELFTYQNRYNGATQELIPPININAELQTKAQNIALAAHQTCSCRHISRIDMIVRNNEIFVLEINTLPGMTAHSLYPKMLKAAGYSISDLIPDIIKPA